MKTKTDPEDFWKDVDIRGHDECWPWRRCLLSDGYGSVRFRGKKTRAHRVALELAEGKPLLKGEWSLHHCDNPVCCNPAHLFRGTPSENMRDCWAKGRSGWQRHGQKQVKGSRHVFSKLNEWQVCSIMAQLLMGRKQTHVAKEFNVTGTVAWGIYNGKGWRHLFLQADLDEMARVAMSAAYEARKP